MNTADVAIPIILTTLLVLLLLSGIAIAFFTLNRQKQRQKAELTQARLDFEKEARQVELELREELVSQFSRELHDNLGHQMTGIRLSVENLKLDLPEQAASFETLDDQLTNASKQIRLLSRSLSQDYVFDLELKQAIQMEIDRYQQLARFKLYWKYNEGPNRMDKAESLVVFRIFQEILTNIQRHAEASEVWIELSQEQGFRMSIKDDGRGFELNDTLLPSKSFGIRNIKKRAAVLGLDCKIITQKGNGCEYQFTKPI